MCHALRFGVLTRVEPAQYSTQNFKFAFAYIFRGQQHDRALDWNSGENAAFYSPLSRCLSGSVSVFPHPTLQFLHRPNGDEGPHFSQWILSPPLVAGLRESYTAHTPPRRANLCVALGRPSPSNFLMYVPRERFGLSLMKNTRTA